MKAIVTVLCILLLSNLAHLAAMAEQTVISVKGAHAVSPAVAAIGEAFMRNTRTAKWK